MASIVDVIALVVNVIIRIALLGAYGIMLHNKIVSIVVMVVSSWLKNLL